MSGPMSGVGTRFLRWNSSTTAWEAIAHVRNITGPGMTKAFIDITSLDSTGGYREFIMGFKDAGQLTMNVLYTRDGYEALKTDYEDDEAKFYCVEIADDDVTSLVMEGFVTEIPLTIPTDEAMTMDVTIKITGSVSLESGSAASPA